MTRVEVETSTGTWQPGLLRPELSLGDMLAVQLDDEGSRYDLWHTDRVRYVLPLSADLYHRLVAVASTRGMTVDDLADDILGMCADVHEWADQTGALPL